MASTAKPKLVQDSQPPTSAARPSGFRPRKPTLPLPYGMLPLRLDLNEEHAQVIEARLSGDDAERWVENVSPRPSHLRPVARTAELAELSPIPAQVPRLF